VADRHAQTREQPFGRTTTRGMAEQPHNSGHARGSARKRDREIRSAFGENASLTQIVPATPSHHPRLDQDRLPMSGQILERSNIRAMPRTG
jgi:hypothetical protein